MAENVYLKTVNFGGFDKKETLQYIDTLLSDIYRLEAEVKEKDEMISSLESGEVQNFSGKEELEAKLDEGKSKISELQASNDTLKLQAANYESDVTEKDSQITSLKNEIEVLKEKLADAEANAAAGGGDSAAFDMGALFMEAKKSADAVVVEAKKAAKKMETDAQELQNQILEDANTQAASIVENAKNQADSTISSANAQADETIKKANAQAETTVDNAKKEAALIREKSADLRASVKAEYSALQTNISKISETFRELFGDNMVKIDNTKELVEEGLGLVNDDVNFNNELKGSGVSERGNNKNTNKTENKAENKSEFKKQEPAKTVKEKKPESQPEKIEKIQEETVPEPVKEEPAAEEKPAYTNSDVEAAQAYYAKLLAEAEAEAMAELNAKIAEDDVPAEETPVVSEQPKPATFSKSFDLDMLSALTKELESKGNSDNKLTDEEFLEKWKNK